jgi:hypothetical protein
MRDVLKVDGTLVRPVSRGKGGLCAEKLKKKNTRCQHLVSCRGWWRHVVFLQIRSLLGPVDFTLLRGRECCHISAHGLSSEAELDLRNDEDYIKKSIIIINNNTVIVMH